MSEYVDAYVVPVPEKNLAVYRRLASMSGKIWRERGAIEDRECAGDDLAVKFGSPFPRQLKLKRGETGVFSWITFKSERIGIASTPR